ERIVRQLPATDFDFRFTLVDLPDVNAFALPGGRVYVTRKLVAFARSEDELAGVVGHEIGHIVTRQIAADMSRVFQEALNVTSFGDRSDIFNQYHRLLESSRLPGESGRHAEQDQFEADRVGLAAVARAGY